MIPSNAKEQLDLFRKYVQQQARTNLTKGNRNVTKKLYNSIGSTAKVSKNSFELSFQMEQYGNYLDKGVKGAVTSLKAPDSPYKFGTGTGPKGGLTQGISKWVKARKFQFRDRETGKFMSYEQTAKLITRSIYLKGTKPTLFFTKPFNKGFEKYINEDLIEAFALDAENLIKFSTNDNS